MLAAAGINRDRDMAAIEELIRLNLMPGADELKGGATDFAALLLTLTAAPKVRDAGACVA